MLTGEAPQAWPIQSRVFVHVVWFWMFDLAMFCFVVSASGVVLLYSRRESTNRLFGLTTKEHPSDTKVPANFKGKKIVILGNGPSLGKGEPLGGLIDEMDEVVRFNNFQTAASGLMEWTGSKTTVHFSDTMLYPSYPEYSVPGTCVVLSLFMDRLIVAGSYCVFRTGIDLEFAKTYGMFSNPSLGWVSHEDITVLKNTLGLSEGKHPTSGVLAIDWFE